MNPRRFLLVALPILVCAFASVVRAADPQLPTNVTDAMNNGLNFGKDLQDGLRNLLNFALPSLVPYSWFELGAISMASFYKVMFSTLARIPEGYHHRIRVVGILVCMFRVTVAAVMLRYYIVPIVGAINFHQLPMFVGQQLTLMVNAAGEKQALLEFNRIIHRMPLPHGLQIIESIGYTVILLLFGAAQFGMTVINASSLLFEGALAIYGLFFVPFFAHISLDGRFWRWWGMVVSYSMYPVTAAIFSFVFAGIYLNFIDKAVNHDYAIAHLLVLVGYLLIVTPILIVSMFQIPRFNDYLFGEVPSAAHGIVNSVQNAVVRTAAAALL